MYMTLVHTKITQKGDAYDENLTFRKLHNTQMLTAWDVQG
jgi:hypothetical protein